MTSDVTMFGQQEGIYELNLDDIDCNMVRGLQAIGPTLKKLKAKCGLTQSEDEEPSFEAGGIENSVDIWDTLETLVQMRGETKLLSVIASRGVSESDTVKAEVLYSYEMEEINKVEVTNRENMIWLTVHCFSGEPRAYGLLDEDVLPELLELFPNAEDNRKEAGDREEDSSQEMDISRRSSVNMDEEVEILLMRVHFRVLDS